MSYYTYHQFAFDVTTRTVRYHRDEKGWYERDDYEVVENEIREAAEELGVTADEAFVYRWVIWRLGESEVRNSVSVRIRRGLAAAKERLFELDPEARHEHFDFISGHHDASPNVVQGVVRAFLEAHARREPRDEHVVLISDGVLAYKAPSRGGRSYIQHHLGWAKRYPNKFEANAAIANDKRKGRRGLRVAVPVRELSHNPSRAEFERYFGE